MLFALSARDWFVILATIGASLSALKAAWHWHASTEILTRDEVAGLSDGRNVLDDVLDIALAQSLANAKAAQAAIFAALFAVIVFVTCLSS
ncbi:hypothetical protein AB4Y96_04000 [Phyllobacterium sp. TAF24]|uniref:hypothetical protein n=1 Tax=unclassified Phyllobacterium TaxID=2638441 RepID=UPI0008903F0B|nr:hypothetical protein [Phyllobacterium sp. OV277]SDP82205.1 hypothetical protein SAMN05443582_11118 [Phyllobacterium sp. OV277]